MPEFPGGAQELMKFISANIEYPEIAQGDMGQGRVIVRFIVDKEGNIIQPKVVRSVDPYLDKEALRIVGLCLNGNRENWMTERKLPSASQSL